MNLDNNSSRSLYQRQSFFSKAGYEVDLYSDYWKLSKDHAFNFDGLPHWIHSEVDVSFREVLAIYGETCSGSYVIAVFRRMRSYFQSTTDELLFTPASLISFRSSLADVDWEMSSVRAFLRTWYSQGYSSVPYETVVMMEKWRIKGNEKGYSVQSMCPESGPFTDVEMQGIVSRVTECYADGSLKLRDTCYAMIVAMTGRRPVQITDLKIKDLILESGKYFISFPRGKQKHSDWRSSFNRFQIVEDLWLLLQAQVDAVKKEFSAALGAPIPLGLISELPIFPVVRKLNPLEDLRDQLATDLLHARVLEVAETLRKVKKVINVISERTGATTHLNSYRFRYTLGTNLAREGRGQYVIAEALDHSDTQQTGVYVKNIPDIVKHIDKAVALSLAPLAQAFQGVLVTDESKVRQGSKRVCSSAGNVGSCGTFGFCGALAPIACYTCAYFQPWLDGPHEFVLDKLLGERENIIASTGDLKIASVNDRLILAVSDVVTRCKAMKNEVANV
ncbi:tyrosine-type recombinase/integrase [Pseudomonas tremae]|uniref:site-specific integrase n=1 Tax=Pseudomonas tremae TaxID=200454 RepID=UPI001F30D83D|nr:site-specific integrase [Pseudomonas tremae]MCF5711032.1 tyrosine-type recombinase/integrase [Pseudomonas tremae]UQB32218.1 tyrosine-type recombinase/integrase [Pseudomonas tremae]